METPLCVALTCMLMHKLYIFWFAFLMWKKTVGGPSCRHQMHCHWLHNVGLRCLWEGSGWGWDPREVTKTSRHYYCIEEVALLEYFNKCKRCSSHMLQKNYKIVSLGCLWPRKNYSDLGFLRQKYLRVDVIEKNCNWYYLFNYNIISL